jgi:hypothetical protein
LKSVYFIGRRARPRKRFAQRLEQRFRKGEAKALDLTILPTLLARADEVTE